jgi:hypothetical protein
MFVSQLCQQQHPSGGGNPARSSSRSRSSSNSALCRHGLSSSNRAPSQLTGCLQHYHICCHCWMHCHMVSTTTPSPPLSPHHHSNILTCLTVPKTLNSCKIINLVCSTSALNCPCMHAGRYIFLDYPFVARAMAPLAPLALLYNGIPFAP